MPKDEIDKMTLDELKAKFEQLVEGATRAPAEQRQAAASHPEPSARLSPRKRSFNKASIRAKNG